MVLDDSTGTWMSLELGDPLASTCVWEAAVHVYVEHQGDARSAAAVFVEAARWETSNRATERTLLVSKGRGRQDMMASEWRETDGADVNAIGTVQILALLRWEAQWDHSLRQLGQVRPQEKAVLAGKHDEHHEPTFESVWLAQEPEKAREV